MKTYKDIVYKKTETRDLCLDLYLPEDADPPLILWIHGGGWRDLNKEWCLVMPQLDKGYAICSVDYRYTDEEVFPAQMHDLKDALAFLKEKASEYGYDSSRIAVSGDSAGGHLAEMMGVSAGNKNWEKGEGDYSVQAVVDFSGAVRIENPEHGDCFSQLVGAPMGTKTYAQNAAIARPVHYIDGSEPPFLILHGSADPVVSQDDPRTLRNALEQAGVPVHMYLVPGGDHGLSGNIVDGVIGEFLDYYLKGITTVITPELQPCHDRTVPLTERYIR